MPDPYSHGLTLPPAFAPTSAPVTRPRVSRASRLILGGAPAETGSGLPDSLAMTAAGPNITLGALDSDGMYPVTLTGTPTNADYVGSDASLAGDYLVEVECTSGAGCFVGVDNAAASNRAATALDERISAVPSIPSVTFSRNLSNVLVALPYTASNHLWFERTGGDINVYEGVDWAGKSLLGTTTALNTGDRWFQFIQQAATGSFRIRFIAHPGV